MKYNIYLFIACITVVFSACVKEESSLVEPQKSKTEKLVDLVILNKIFNDRTGDISIANTKGFGPQEGGVVSASIIRASFYNDKKERENAGVLNVSGIELSPDPKNNNIYSSHQLDDNVSISSLFGQNVALNLEGLADRNTEYVLSDSIDLPKEIFVSSPFVYVQDTIQRDVTINWNADPNNSYDVFILIDYHPDEPFNEAASIVYPKRYYKVIPTPDDGTHQLS
ncbi:MAG: hypothetical protein AAGG75_24660, partial [Bacteroidota bacterium]